MAECIYKFVEQPKPKKPKKKTYRSKHDPNGPIIGSTFGMQGTNVVDGKGFVALKKVSENIDPVHPEIPTLDHFRFIFALGSFIKSEPRRDLVFRSETPAA